MLENQEGNIGGYILAKKTCKCGTVLKKYQHQCIYCRKAKRSRQKIERSLRKEMTDALKIRRRSDVFSSLLDQELER